ncbi:MAG: AI-2E family transporter [Alphaproteobacteria bacterium]|nr:AI-2E family transporter [Alphaproteobacteria bacterium]
MNKNTWFLIGILALAVFVYQISGILLPFVLAFVLAYALNPVTDKISKKMPRGLASGLLVTAVLFIVISLVLIVVPILQSQVMDFTLRVPKLVNLIWDKLKDILTYGRQNMTEQQLYQLSDSVSGTASNIFQGLGAALMRIISGGMAVFSLVSLLLITPVVLFYLMRDWPQVSKNVKEMVPMKKRTEMENLMKEINTTLSGFIRGQASVCLILAIYYATALSLVGLEMGALVGILTGVLIFIPYIGYGIGLILSVLLGLLQGLTMTQWLCLAGVFLVGQIAEGYFLTPYLVGKRVGLHPVWVIFVLLAGGMLAGFLGIILAVPVAAILGVLIRYLLKWYQQTDFYKGHK